MNELNKILCLGFSVLIGTTSVFTCNAQDTKPIVKERVEKIYRLIEEDSIIREHTTLNYDKEARLIRKQAYFYDVREPEVLTKETKANFDAASQEMVEHIIYYKKNEDPTREKLETKYLLYTGQEETSKYVWRKLYDKFGEITKEDTITYNEAQQITQKCIFDYRGNTSLYCYDYDYNKKGQEKRWRMFSKWTTISMKGTVVDRKAKRKETRFKYNAKGQLVRTCGRNYSTRFTQKISYHPNGEKAKDETVLRRRVRNSKEKQKKTGKKYWTRKDITTYTYNKKGLPLLELTMFGEEVKAKIEKVYEQDSLLTEVKHYDRKVLVEDAIYEYNKEGKLKHSATNKRHSNGKLRYVVDIVYNEEGQPLVEKQLSDKKILSHIDYHYNEDQLIETIEVKVNNGTAFEHKAYKYTYYP